MADLKIIRHPVSDPIVTKKVTKKLVSDIYKFMLEKPEIKNLDKYFEEKNYYMSAGYIFEPEWSEIFVSNHWVAPWIKK